MGLLDGRSNSFDASGRQRRRSSSYHGSTRGFSPARSTTSRASASRGGWVRPSGSSSQHRSNSSFFGASGGSSRGIFGFGGSGSSYYKRSPRGGYVSYLFHKLQRMLRELWYYARKHPVKAFFAVIVPLLSAGGAIHGLMRQFGGMGGRGTRRMGGGYYGSSGYGGMGGGLFGNAGNLMSVARSFM